MDYFKAAGLGRAAISSFAKILLDPVRARFLAKNLLYDVPYVGRNYFAANVRKIAPSLRASDLEFAKGVGGMRLQRVDTKTQELLLGEGKIVGEKVIFNMTPSPGASVCLYNGLRDAEEVVGMLGSYRLERERLKKELGV